jgi:hypothetical protein
MNDVLETTSLEEDKKARFIQHIATKDGCPSDEAAKFTWDSMVESFFDGNDKAARQHLAEWEKEHA